MTEDRLYRLTIPGAIFIFLLAGWLVADPHISFLGILKLLKLEGTGSLSVLVLGGGLVLLTFGYLCGEICFALGVPDPRLDVKPSKPEFVRDAKHYSFWIILLIVGIPLFMFVVFGTTWVKEYFYCALSAALFIVHAIAVRYVLVMNSGCGFTLDTHCAQFFPKIAVNRRPEFNLEMISAYTHMRISAVSEDMHKYLTRAWSRVIIGVHSVCATILAMLGYSILRTTLMTHGAGSSLGVTNSNSQAVILHDFMPVYTGLNCALVVVLYWSIHRQLAHRMRLYAVILNSDIEVLSRVPKDSCSVFR